MLIINTGIIDVIVPRSLCSEISVVSGVNHELKILGMQRIKTGEFLRAAPLNKVKGLSWKDIWVKSARGGNWTQAFWVQGELAPKASQQLNLS